jgi:hypothetical protein
MTHVISALVMYYGLINCSYCFFKGKGNKAAHAFFSGIFLVISAIQTYQLIKLFLLKV